MSVRSETVRLPTIVDGVSLVPELPGSGGNGTASTISLYELKTFSLTLYRQELAATVGLSTPDRERKDRNKVNVYSSYAFNAAARLSDWSAPAEEALKTALAEVEALENNRKPRAELQRALRHLKQFEQAERKGGHRGSPQNKSPTPRGAKVKKAFAILLSSSIEAENLPIAELARQVEMGAKQLWGWANGIAEPSESSRDMVDRIEARLQLNHNQLWNLRSTIYWPDGFPDCKKARARVLRKCRGLAKLSKNEQAAVIWKSHNEPVKTQIKRSLGRDLTKWPVQLRLEVEKMFSNRLNRAEPALAN